MNGIHDMGGLHWLGSVNVEKDEPVFHARWEGRIFAMTQVLDRTGIYNLDEHRHEIELMHPARYLDDGYYGRWLFAMESILHRKNILRHDELDAKIAGREPAEADRVRNWPLPAEQHIRWGAWRKEEVVTPKFRQGDRVRVHNHQPSGHTRLPAYLRGKVGEVSIVNEQAWIYPDTRAHNRGEKVQSVYNVSFLASEVWGDAAEPNAKLRVDLSEDYLVAEE